MTTERHIRDAERARLEAIVAEHGTEAERFQLLISGIMRNGVTRAQLEGSEPVGYLSPEPEFLVRLARRVERRTRLGLPAVVCAGNPPTRYGCDCLERALDDPGDGGKRAVLELAAGLHWSPPPRVEPAEPIEAEPPALARAEARESELVRSEPSPRPDPEPRPRIVVRSRRWYDNEPRFDEMKF